MKAFHFFIKAIPIRLYSIKVYENVLDVCFAQFRFVLMCLKKFNSFGKHKYNLSKLIMIQVKSEAAWVTKEFKCGAKSELILFQGNLIQ